MVGIGVIVGRGVDQLWTGELVGTAGSRALWGLE